MSILAGKGENADRIGKCKYREVSQQKAALSTLLMIFSRRTRMHQYR